MSGASNSSLTACNKLTVMPSGPGAEFGFSPLILSLILLVVKTTFSSLTSVSDS